MRFDRIFIVLVTDSQIHTVYLPHITVATDNLVFA